MWKTVFGIALVETILLCAGGAYADCPDAEEGAKAIIATERAFEHTISNEFNKDPLTAMKYYATDRIQMFDAMPADEHGGLEVSTAAFPNHFKDIGPQYIGTMQFLDLRSKACGDLGYASMVQYYVGKGSDGQQFEWRLRGTDVLQKIDGKWKIIHEHLSFPIDMATTKAQMDSKY